MKFKNIYINKDVKCNTLHKLYASHLFIREKVVLDSEEINLSSSSSLCAYEFSSELYLTNLQ